MAEGYIIEVVWGRWDGARESPESSSSFANLSFAILWDNEIGGVAG